MKAIHFMEDNRVIGASNKKVPIVPIRYDDTNEQTPFLVVYKMTFKERIKALLFGVVYCQQRTFGGSYNPLFLTMKKSEVLDSPRVPLRLKVRFFFDWHFRNSEGTFLDFVKNYQFDHNAKVLFERDKNLALRYLYNEYKKIIFNRYLLRKQIRK